MAGSLLQNLKRAWESGNAEAVARLHSDDAVFPDAVGRRETLVRGPQPIRGIVEEMFRAPRARFEVTSLARTEYGGVAEWVYSWRSEQRGRRNVLKGASVIRVRRNRVVRESSYYDPDPELD